MMCLLKRLSLTFRFPGTDCGCVVKYSLGAPYSFREELDRSALQFNYFQRKQLKPNLNSSPKICLSGTQIFIT